MRILIYIFIVFILLKGLPSPSVSKRLKATHTVITSKASTTAIASPTSTTTRHFSAASSTLQGTSVTPITSSISRVSTRSSLIVPDVVPSSVKEFTTVTVQPTTQQVNKGSATSSSVVTDISSSVKDFTTATLQPTTLQPETSNDMFVV